MPIINRQDASDVDEFIERIFAAGTADGRFDEIQSMFVAKLDFDRVFESEYGLEGAPSSVTLPATARVVARLEDTHVVYVDLAETGIDTNRVRKSEASEAARLIERELGGDLLLVFTNRDCDQLHFVLPNFERRRPALRRMIVERDLPRRTAIQQLSNIYWKWDRTGDIRSALESAFDVEAVTEEFFAEYKRVFEVAMGKISGFEDDAGTKNLFVQTMFNRLMFVYFLSRKGWLRFDGEKDYLNALWDSYALDVDQTNFYQDRLTHLFFVGLNNLGARDLIGNNNPLRAVIGDVPFLNGGLFAKEEIDERSGITVPDDAIEPIFRGLFDRFNFTVMESTPLDVEVAVDPEMLGKVFEELVTGRHESGSYYTPRPVVSFMCREALKGFLSGRDTGLTDDAISVFVDEHDTSGIGLTEAQEVSRGLSEITVIDPACGSGAYLLGMMQELVDLQSALYSDQLRADARSLYRQKLDIIERNLYGADNDHFAVNIAMLRLWLSLVIEYEGDHPEPLPNLDYKIVCGDSLLGADPSSESGADFYRHLTQQLDLRGNKASYMRATDVLEKQRLKREIDDAEDQIRQTMGDATLPEGVVDWAIDFADVFAPNDGFDVVVANPPFVNSVEMERKASEYRQTLRSKFATANGAFDIFVPFIERGIQLMSRGGLLAYITPNKLLSAQYAKDSRDYVLKQTQLMSIIDMSYVTVFDASVYPVVTVAKKRSCNLVEDEINIFSTNEDHSPWHHINFERKARLSDTLPFTDSWSPLLSDDAMKLFSVFKGSPRLVDVAQINGAATVKEAYEWKDALIDQGHSLERLNADRYRRFIVSGNIRPYFQTWSVKGVQYIKHRYIQPVLDTHHSTISDNRRRQITSPKLIVSGLSKRLTCLPDLQGLAAGKSTVIIIPGSDYDIMFLCGLLNSDLMNRLYHAMYASLSLSGGYLRFGPPQLKTLPIPRATLAEQEEVASLVRQRLIADVRAVMEIENRIEIALANMLGLSEREQDVADQRGSEYIEIDTRRSKEI